MSTPSEKAMEAEAKLGDCTCTPQYPDGDRKFDCTGCIYLQYQRSGELSLRIQFAIDALVAEARAEAMEECAKIADSLADEYDTAERVAYHAETANNAVYQKRAAETVAAAIRTLAAKGKA